MGQEQDILRDEWGSSLAPLVSSQPRANNFDLVTLAISPELRAELLEDTPSNSGTIRLMNAIREYLEERE